LRLHQVGEAVYGWPRGKLAGAEMEYIMDNDQKQVSETTKVTWVAPQVLKMEAGAAEVNSVTNVDGAGGSNFS
jgi:hypothetical protein